MLFPELMYIGSGPFFWTDPDPGSDPNHNLEISMPLGLFITKNVFPNAIFMDFHKDIPCSSLQEMHSVWPSKIRVLWAIWNPIRFRYLSAGICNVLPVHITMPLVSLFVQKFTRVQCKKYRYRNTGRAKASVGDPDPDPHVFEPPGSGSGSTSQRYGSGSGSFYHYAKIVRKTLIPTILWLFLTFYLWKIM